MRRLFTVLAGTSLLLCVLIVALWPIAVRHPCCRVTIHWVEQGNTIQSTVYAIGWDKYGIFKENWTEVHLLEGQSNQATRIRQLFNSICPPGRDTTLWGTGSESFSAWPIVERHRLVSVKMTGSGSWEARIQRPPFALLCFMLMILPSIWVLTRAYRWHHDRASS